MAVIRHCLPWKNNKAGVEAASLDSHRMHARTHEDCTTLHRFKFLPPSCQGQGKEAGDRCGSSKASQGHILGPQGREGVQGGNWIIHSQGQASFFTLNGQAS